MSPCFLEEMMARPKKEPTKAIISLTIRIPEDMHEQLNGLASDQDRSINWVINDLLRKALDKLIEKELAKKPTTT